MDEAKKHKNFIYEEIDKDLESKRFANVITRFPPEPNGYLHVGHAKSICLNSGIARDYNGGFNLRFDDTNPCKEEQEYVDSIIEDVLWLSGRKDVPIFYASDYFPQMHAWAVQLIKAGKAYVCEQTAEEVRLSRGTLQEPGRPSPWRERTIEENTDLFTRMTKGEFPDGSKTLRAKIDMAHPNLNMRDPVMYRILHAEHHRQGNTWCVYPMYDWAHGLEDSLETISHSICTLEFENHRPLYDWYIEQLGIYHPRQIEFARLNLSHTVMSKRKLLQLVKEKHVAGWDDPRMPTICGLRRRGYTAEALQSFCERIGVAKFYSVIELNVLENAIRDELNKSASRYMAVLDPIKVVIENYPENGEEFLTGVNNPEDESAGTRQIPFAKEFYIEREDFMENPPKDFFRMSVGREVRLRYAYFVTCTGFDKDASGNVTQIRCTYDPATKGGDSPDGRKVKATLHWVSANHAKTAEARLYETLFTEHNPDKAEEGKTFLDYMNPKSLTVLPQIFVEPALADAAKNGGRFQFERKAYFFVDPKDSTAEKPVFNRIVTLKDQWAKAQAKK